MVILVSILIIINSSVNSKMGYGAFYVICPRAFSQYVTPLIINSQEALSRVQTRPESESNI